MAQHSSKCHFTPHNLMKNHKLLKALGPLLSQLSNTGKRKGENSICIISIRQIEKSDLDEHRLNLESF